MNWYGDYNQALDHAYSPRLLASGQTADDKRWMVLEDLKTLGMTPKSQISWTEVKLCLRWLAQFHKTYLGNTPDGIWPIGTYWHLETRPDELEALEDQELKQAAKAIDEKLNAARFHTFVHGDAKLANFLFHTDRVAAVDFQYVGGGVGIKDVAYFMSSIYDESELQQNETRCLDYYFSELALSEVEEEWRALYPWAWCDFYRFLQGWSPGHYKINSYSERLKNEVLSWDLKSLCEVAQKAALAAGKIISEGSSHPIEVQSKDGGENLASQVVTEIDLKAEKIILETLQPTIEQYDLGLLSEETTADSRTRLEKEYFWCIDPLDGTLCFSRNEDGYSTSIALVQKSGEPLIGVVYSPKTQTLYSAIKGQGAVKNGEPFVAAKDKPELTLLYDQSFLKHATYESQMEHMKDEAQKMGLSQVRKHHLGGAVMNGITTIEMAPAIYYKMPKKAQGGGSIWDFAASSIIQSEAGGFNGDFFRQPLDLNSPNSTFMNEKGIIYCSSNALLPLIPTN